MSTPTPKFSTTITRHAKPYPFIDPQRSELSAHGKVVLITGGGQGIGLSIALALASANARTIAILGRTESTLTAAKLRILGSYPAVQVLTFVADVTNEHAIEEVFSTVKDTAGPIDVCISNASHFSKISPLALTDIEDWWLAFETNVKGALIVAKAFLRTKSITAPTFINISTSAVHRAPTPGFSSYAASKFAMIKVTEYLQAENSEVKVIDVHPGTVESDMSTVAAAKYGISFTFDDYNLSGHFVVWLASQEADFLKGRFVWAVWDAEELKIRAAEIIDRDILRISLAE